MKKITILLLLIVSTLIFQTLQTEAEEVDTQLSKETVTLIDKGRVAFSNVDFNQSNYNSTGYVTLNMGYSTRYTMDLSNILQYFDYYEQENVSRIYLQFDLDAVYTGIAIEQHRWLSSNSNWDEATQTIDLNNELTNTVEAEVWWNINGQSGGAPSIADTGSLRIYKINLVVEYVVPIDVYTVIEDWAQLPIGTKLLTNDITIEDFFNDGQLTLIQIEETVPDKFDLFFNLAEGDFVARDIQIPRQKNTGTPIFTFYFATTTERFLVFLYQLNEENIWDSDFVVWNLNTSEFNESYTQTIYGVSSVRGDGINHINMMFVDIVIPWDLDSIVSITMSYQYRHHYLIGGFGDWIKVNKRTLVEGSSTAYELPYYRVWSWFVTKVVNQMVGGNILERSQIREVTGEYNLADKVEFASKINNQYDLSLSHSNIFIPQAKVYELYLGQSNKFGSNAVELKDVAILNIRYMNDFQEYSFDFPPQLITDAYSNYDDKPSFLDKVWAFIVKLYLPFCLIVSAVLTKFVYELAPKFFKKYSLILVAVYGVIFYLLYFNRP